MSPTFHVSLFKPVHDTNMNDNTNSNPPPPIEVEGTFAYLVKDILDSKRRRGWLYYLVYWEGFSTEERLGVDAHDIFDPSLTADFHQAHPNCAAPRARGCLRRTPGGIHRRVGFCNSSTLNLWPNFDHFPHLWPNFDHFTFNPALMLWCEVLLILYNITPFFCYLSVFPVYHPLICILVFSCFRLSIAALFSLLTVLLTYWAVFASLVLDCSLCFGFV